MLAAFTRAWHLPHSRVSSPRLPPRSWLRRLKAFVGLIAEVRDETQSALRAAHQRFQFVDW